MQCRLVVHGSGSLFFDLDSGNIKMSEITWDKVVTQLWGVLCWFEESCVYVYCILDSSEHPSTGCIELSTHLPVLSVPQCVDLNKNLQFSLIVPLLTLPFGWLKDFFLLRTCFCLCKITFFLEMASDCGLKCFLGIIIHYGSDFFLDNCFQKMLFSSGRAVIMLFSPVSMHCR